MKKTLENLINDKKFITISLFAYLALIFYVSSLPSPGLHLEFKYEDKFKHFAAYSVMGVLILRYAIYVLNFKTISTAVKFSIVINYWRNHGINYGILYGISDELHQGFLGYFDTGIFSGLREASFADWVADAMGIITAISGYYRVMLKEKSTNIL